MYSLSLCTDISAVWITGTEDDDESTTTSTKTAGDKVDEVDNNDEDKVDNDEDKMDAKCVGQWGDWSPCREGEQHRFYNPRRRAPRSSPALEGGENWDSTCRVHQKRSCGIDCVAGWSDPWSE